MRDLLPDEVTDLLNRHFDLNGRVLQFQRIVDAGQWDQWRQNEASWLWGIVYDLPIPTRGVSVVDDKYGTVVIFPDVAGVLHYVGNVQSGVGVQINLPPFQSLSGNSLEQTLADLVKGVGKIAAGVVVVMLLYSLAVKHL
jgi:hypothetical protein